MLLVAALPFRIPIDVSGDEVNLLVPLYVVIAAGTLAYAIDAFAAGGREPERPRLLPTALAVAIVLYALQASYSGDVPFFLIPFAAMFVLLTEVRWTSRVLAATLGVIAAEAAVFSLVGIGQFVTADIFWNPALERSNDFHFYFRVNSLFWDPNIYGRYLAMAAVLAVAVVMWIRDARRVAIGAGVLAVLLAGLAVGFSQTSFVAVLAGIAVLCALRYSLLGTAIATPLALVAIAGAIVVVGGTSEAEDSAEEVSSGRTTLIEGGLDLAAERPLAGYGSASFSEAFAEQEDINRNQTAVAHNEPVTVAAEQGAIGLLAYAATIAAALWTLLAGMRRIAPGLGAADAIGDPATGGQGVIFLARIGLVAAFAALLVHTVGYGAYLTDPLTWALLGIGGALAAAGPPAPAGSSGR